jgi:hypothetical protein
MKREWEGSFKALIACVWLVGGCVVAGVVAAATEGPRGAMSTAGEIAFGAWLGPLLGAALFIEVREFARELIPRRVQRPVLEDARDAHKRGAA